MKKKTLSRVGAGALAVATVVTGLSFGPAAMAAPNIDLKASPSATTQTGKLVAQRSATQFAGFTVNSSNEVDWNYESTQAAAEADSLDWTMPEIGQSGQIKDAANRCMYAMKTTLNIADRVKVANCGSLPAGALSTFTLEENGTFALGGQRIVLAATSVGGGPWRSFVGFSASGYPFVGAVTGMQFTASVESRDAETKSAVLSGVAVPGAVVVVNGSQQVQADASTGAWSATVSGLTLGQTNSIPVEEYVNQAGSFVKKQTRSVAVNFEIANLTADVVPGDLETEASITGIAQPGATIEVRDRAGKVIATGGTTGPLGSYTVSIPAPNAAGDYPVAVSQVFEGETLGNLARTIAYGAGVQITSPVDNAAHDGGSLRMTGTGKPGSKVTVREAGKNTVIGSTDVLVSGTWNLDTTALDGRKHELVVSQAGTGKNVTTATVTLNPEAIAEGLVITSPVDNATVVAADNMVPFSGTGEPGAKVVLKAQNGREVINTTVGDDGKWSATGFLGHQWYELATVYTVPGEAPVNGKTHVTVLAEAPVTQPFSVTTPAENSTVIAPDNRVDFAGKGTAGATIVIKAQNGREVIRTTVANNGTWSATGVLGFQWYELDTISTRKDGTVESGKLHITVKASAGVTQPFSLSTPADNSSVVAPDNMVTFTGKGTTGATVVLRAQNGRAVITTIVDDKGNWSAKGFLGFQWYELDTEYTAPGAAVVVGKTHVTVLKSADVINPFTIDSPANGSTVAAPGGVITFSGKGASGATVQIINDKGGAFERDVINTKVKEDGTWSAIGYVNPNHSYPNWTFVHTPGAAGGSAAQGNYAVTFVTP